MTASNSSFSVHHTNDLGEHFPKRRRATFTLCATLQCVLAAATAFALLSMTSHAHAAGVAKDKPKAASAPAASHGDPLARDVWHAMGSTWPGTIVFDGAAKKVVLSPVGAKPINASYSVGKVTTTAGVTSGELHMTSTEGQVVNATFTVKNDKDLSLHFVGGQTEETYTRLNAKEEEAEKARFAAQLAQKRAGH